MKRAETNSPSDQQGVSPEVARSFLGESPDGCGEENNTVYSKMYFRHVLRLGIVFYIKLSALEWMSMSVFVGVDVCSILQLSNWLQIDFFRGSQLAKVDNHCARTTATDARIRVTRPSSGRGDRRRMYSK